MSKQLINIGSAPNDDSGDNPRSAAIKINSNADELYAQSRPKGIFAYIASSTAADSALADYVCDGTADEVQIQSAIDAASAAGGGIVELSGGTFAITDSIICKSNVWLRGQGWSTILAPSWSAVKSAIDWTRTDRSAADPHVNMWFTDFKIDCTAASNPSYVTNNKGIFIQFLRRCVFRNLWIHNSFATALGTDYMVECVIDSCLITDFGRGMSPAGSGVGGNGIGIGTGESSEESLIISNCHVLQTKALGNNGIMFEDQQATAGIIAKYMHVADSTMIGCHIAARVSGVENVTYSGCTMAESMEDGLYIDKGLSASTQQTKELVVTGCQIKNNGSGGIDGSGVSTTPERITFSNNVISGNAHGIILRKIKGVVIEGNQIFGNSTNGILIRPNNTLGDIEHVLIAGNRLDSNGVAHVSVENFSMRHLQVINNQFIGGASGLIVAGSLLFQNSEISNNVFEGQSSSAIYLGAGPSDVSIRANRINSPGAHGITMANGDATRLTVVDNEIIGATRGVYLFAGESVVVRGNRIAQSSEYGVIFNPSGGDTLTHLLVDSNLVSESQLSGIAILPTTAGVVDRARICENVCYNNNLASSTHDGIKLGNSSQSVLNAVVCGNVCYDSQASKTQRYGISTVGTVTGLTLRANIVRDNLTDGLLLSGTGGDQVVEDNVGYTP